MKTRFALAGILAMFLLVPAAPARADVVLTPYVGSFFGGNLPDDSGVAFGGTAAFMGNGIFGAEVGFNYTPDFIKETLVSPDVSQASLMGNLIVGIPMGDADQGGQIRPYVTGGVGLFRTASDESDLFDRVTSNDFALNAGGGILAFFSEHVGVRADVRYFRTLTDEDPGEGLDFDISDLDFWKWDVGAAFRF